MASRQNSCISSNTLPKMTYEAMITACTCTEFWQCSAAPSEKRLMLLDAHPHNYIGVSSGLRRHPDAQQ